MIKNIMSYKNVFFLGNLILLLFFYSETVMSDGIPVTEHKVVKVENKNVLIEHEHFIEKGETISSTLTIRRKNKGAELKIDIAPLTNIAIVENENLFVGLSNFKSAAFKHGYNFVLFNENGDLLQTAFIFSNSGHCQGARESVSQWVNWFDLKSPKVRVIFESGVPDRVFVKNPFDKKGTSDECVILVD